MNKPTTNPRKTYAVNGKPLDNSEETRDRRSADAGPKPTGSLDGRRPKASADTVRKDEGDVTAPLPTREQRPNGEGVSMSSVMIVFAVGLVAIIAIFVFV